MCEIQSAYGICCSDHNALVLDRGCVGARFGSSIWVGFNNNSVNELIERLN